MDESERAVAAFYHGMRAAKKGRRMFTDDEVAELRRELERQGKLPKR